jgi:D-sedoheptulose 7-phosphate isomerase
VSQALAVDRFVARRTEANTRFFVAEAERIALLCRELAERFERGGRLLAVGASPQAWSDAHHVAVEFVHPVIVGKRALPALAIDSAGLDALREPDDAVVSFEPLRFGLGENEWRFDPPSDDSFVRQELCETLYHVVWELVHVFFDAGGTVLAFGNGGSATDAEDLVADLRAAPEGWPSRRALDLSGDAAILTALANDIGPEVLFQRQVIAYARTRDVVVALSTSGNSANVIAALEEARRRGLRTVALVGYDGGRVASERLADHVVVSRSEHVPRIQEAQASAYHVLRELVEAGG